MAYILLADGTKFYGTSVGYDSYAVGEIVFNTSQTGYQEILSDPSYYGQIITFTAAHIGNVGVNDDDYEALNVGAFGAIFKNFSELCSNWRAKETLKTFLIKHKLVAITDVDTRAITLHLRDHGSQNACIMSCDMAEDEAHKLIKNHPSFSDWHAVERVQTKESYVYKTSPHKNAAKIVVIDCGVKLSILHMLAQHNVNITVVPESITAQELFALQPNGVLLSNGPGDPTVCHNAINLAKVLLEKKIPTFGICLGHQILGIAAGACTKKMKFGHHGANHPIKCIESGTVAISSQNHGYVIDELTLPNNLHVTHTSLFDGTIAGLSYGHAPALSFQGHPEAGPGPHDLTYLFEEFMKRVQNA
jgi:carbamoyl-phosphate synthase small subunit